MNTIVQIQNLKCGGCETTIRKVLLKLPFVNDLHINVKESSLSLSSITSEEMELLKSKLSNLGYPIAKERNSLGKKAKSYLSCAVGSINK